MKKSDDFIMCPCCQGIGRMSAGDLDKTYRGMRIYGMSLLEVNKLLEFAKSKGWEPKP